MVFCSYLETLAQYLLVEEMNKRIQIIYAQNLFFQKCFLHIIIIAYYYNIRELIKILYILETSEHQDSNTVISFSLSGK